jgi:hypothetical protein
MCRIKWHVAERWPPARVSARRRMETEGSPQAGLRLPLRSGDRRPARRDRQDGGHGNRVASGAPR